MTKPCLEWAGDGYAQLPDAVLSAPSEVCGDRHHTRLPHAPAVAGAVGDLLIEMAQDGLNPTSLGAGANLCRAIRILSPRPVLHGDTRPGEGYPAKHPSDSEGVHENTILPVGRSSSICPGQPRICPPALIRRFLSAFA